MDRISTAAFRTETDFTLPMGYVDEAGVRHQRGVMRLATAADEILPLRDARVQANPAYLTVIVLARVIVRLGSLPAVDTQIVEGLFAADFEYLRRLYEQVNGADEPDGVPALQGANGAAAGGLAASGEA
jgi:hypothetical protein